jgi:hypothetical protein
MLGRKDASMGLLTSSIVITILVAVALYAVIAPRMRKQTPRDREILRNKEDRETGSHPMFP